MRYPLASSGELMVSRRQCCSLVHSMCSTPWDGLLPHVTWQSFRSISVACESEQQAAYNPCSLCCKRTQLSGNSSHPRGVCSKLSWALRIAQRIRD